MRFHDSSQLQNKADAVALAYVTGGNSAARQLADAIGVKINDVSIDSVDTVTVRISNSAGSATASAAP